MKLEPVCDSESPGSAVGTYLCSLDAGHDGLHTWHSPTGKGSPDRLWTDGGVDFLGGPYDDHWTVCNSEFIAPDQTHYMCVRPVDHSGQHGNYHASDIPVLWGGELDRCHIFVAGEQCLGVADHGGAHQFVDGEDVPSTYGTLTELAKTPEGAHIPARFEIVINGGAKAVAKKVRLNGLELPNVHDLSVEYGPSSARTVIVEILATDIIEVPS